MARGDFRSVELVRCFTAGADDLSAAYEITIANIRSLLDQEVRAGVVSDMARFAVITDVRGRILATVTFVEALAGNEATH
jgi:hypothetical protein